MSGWSWYWSRKSHYFNMKTRTRTQDNLQSIYENLPERLIKQALKSNQELLSAIKEPINKPCDCPRTENKLSLSTRATHLHHRRVDLEYLLLALDLSDTDLAGELRRGGAVSLQREGTLQGTLVTGPHLRKGELLRREERQRAYTEND